MKLHRLAAVELRPPPRELRRFGFRAQRGAWVQLSTFNGPSDSSNEPDRVDLAPVRGGAAPTISMARSTGQPPAQLLIDAIHDVEIEVVGDRAQLPDEPREACEQALAQMSNLLGVLTQAAFDVYSPRPYVFLEPEGIDETQVLSRLSRVGLPSLRGAHTRQAPGVRGDMDFAALLHDRVPGVAFLGSALAAGHGVAKLHELMRLFENGFARAGNALVEPLLTFLRSYPVDLGYTRGEVREWVKDLRDPATHADRQRTIMDPAVEPHLHRIEQAAYDVLFNKKRWHVDDPRREQRWNFYAMQDRSGTQIVSGDLAVLHAFDDFDHFGAFRLHEGVRVSGFPDDWLGVDWYFSDPSDSDAPTRPGTA